MKEIISQSIGVIGLILGIVITTILGNVSNYDNRVYESRKIYFENKVSLIAKVAELIGQNPGSRDLFLEYKTKLLKKESLTATSEKLSVINADYHKTLILISLYFGKEVNDYLKDLYIKDGPFWEKVNTELLDKMIKDTYSYINNQSKNNATVSVSKIIGIIGAIISIIGTFIVTVIAVRGIPKEGDLIKAPSLKLTIVGWFFILFGFVFNLLSFIL